MSTPLSEFSDSRRGALDIARSLREGILQGRHRPGDQLPAISELARRHRATAVTVRRALRALEEEGLLRVEHGVGTFVRDWAAQFDRLPLPSFSEAVRSMEESLETRLCGRRFGMVCPEAASALGASPDEPLDVLERLRLAGGIPIVLQSSYLRAELREVTRAYTPERSLYELLSETTGRTPLSAEETLRAVSLPAPAARALRAAEGAPAWRSVRTTYDTAGRPLVFDEAYLSGERVELRVERRAGQARLEFRKDEG
jgi:GntR family transcriptional regulator